MPRRLEVLYQGPHLLAAAYNIIFIFSGVDTHLYRFILHACGLFFLLGEFNKVGSKAYLGMHRPSCCHRED